MESGAHPGTPIEYFDERYQAAYSPILDRRSEQEVEFLILHVLHVGDVVLDVACGYGRHAVALAKKGFQVIGVDASPTMVRSAKERVAGLHPLPVIVESDIRTFDSPIPPTAALLLFSSAIGYGNAKNDAEILSAIANQLPKNGRFVLDGKNPEALSNFTEDSPGTDDFETHWLEGNIWHMVHRSDEKKSHLSMRLYAMDEMRELLERAGFSISKAFAGYEDKPFTGTEQRYLIVAEKK